MRSIRNRGFSLIELMVVIAIVAVLSAVALPAYKTYMYKTKVQRALMPLDALVKDQILYYNIHREWPTGPLSFNGQLLNNEEDVKMDLGNLKYLRFSNYGHDAIRFLVSISGLEGMGTYVAPDETSPNFGDGHLNYVSILVYPDANGDAAIACGFNEQPDDNWGVPLAYLPSNCQCSYLNDRFVYGVGAGNPVCP